MRSYILLRLHKRHPYLDLTGEQKDVCFEFSGVIGFAKYDRKVAFIDRGYLNVHSI